MVRKAFALIALVSFSSLATAQDFILTYTGELTGTESTILTGATDPTPIPFSEAFSGFLALSGPVDNLTLDTSSGLASGSAAPWFNSGPDAFFSSGPLFQVTTIGIVTQGGSIVGANVSINDSPTSTLTISADGAASEFAQFGSRIVGDCESQLGAITNSTPGTVANPGPAIPCSFNGSTTTGTWKVTSTSAPEIDPASSLSALTLLMGVLAVMRGRRNREQITAGETLPQRSRL